MANAYKTITPAEVRRRYVEAGGGHFFDRATMRTWRSRIYSGYEGAAGIYFVTSEQAKQERHPKFCVRKLEEKSIVTLQRFSDKEDARKYAKILASAI